MSENRLFIKADVSYSDRWLYQSETFRKQKNFNISLPNEREFMTGECIVTDKDDTAYSIDELVNLLNYFNRCTVSNKEFMELKEENEQLKQFQTNTFTLINEMIETANFYRTPIHTLDYGDDLGYWNGVYQKLKELRDILGNEQSRR